MLAQAMRYFSVGVINTLVSLLTIWGLMRLGAGPIVANMGGYAIGLTVSFFLNRSWTFDEKFHPAQIRRYALAFLISYGLNLMVLKLCLSLLGTQSLWAHLPAMAAYTVCFFILSKFYVFTPEKAEE